tara:strand:+ start:183 stop:917 length:735 start_codon:yes stop_codon:yes gene_type:complete
LFFYQRKLLYHPGENNYLDDASLNHNIEKVYIPSDQKLVAWHFKKNPKFKTLLFFHGNAGKIDNRIYKLNEFSKLNINYLIFAYRGFSGNEGEPTEKGLYKDARAVKYWLNLNNIQDNEIILYGESLGTAVAVDLAKEFNFSGIILESPFTSMQKLAKIYYPYLPIKLLLKDKYKTDEKIQNINSSILIMHGKQDKIVPFFMGEKIFDLAKNPKYSFFEDYDDHMMDYSNSLLDSLDKFIKSLN